MKRRVLAATPALVSVLLTAAAAAAAVPASEAQRLANAARVVQDIRATIPQGYWDRAQCIAVVPELKKAAFIVGGEFGKGVMSCRSGERWSAPVFMQLAKGSWGFQAGAQQVDLVMLVMNESGVQKLLGNKVNLGADASVAAGPVGRQGSVGTDAQLTAEIVSYSRAQGLFAGIDLSGGVLRPDDDANRNVYGANATPRTILASREISAPTEASAFLSALGTRQSSTGTEPVAAANASKPARPPSSAADTTTASTQQPAASTPSTARPPTIPTSDDDIRTRATEMQQTLDRLLADATTSATGTTGTSGGTTTADAGSSGKVTVDRARLFQLREQLNALIAALNKR
jgi:lipid-binding SYLF domain-containing protein